MIIFAAWAMLALGIGHTLTGLLWFKRPIAQACRDGFVGQFGFESLEIRRLAFWFTLFGPLLVMGGHVAIHAAQSHDLALLRILGWYMLSIAVCGVLALPKSPFWAALLLSPVFLAGGYGWPG